jgi:hypothetical protein
MRALYAAEGGAKMGKKEIAELLTKEVEAFCAESGEALADWQKEVEKCMTSYVPYSVYSFSDLDKARAAQEESEAIYDLFRDFRGLTENVMYANSEEIPDKPAAIEALAKEYSSRLKKPKEEKQLAFSDRVKAVVRELVPGLFKEQDAGKPVSGLLVWKEENGDFRWIARFSNNFRDSDNPPEIISKESHLKFIERVEKGLAPYPELWIWHRPEWKIGQSDWLAYDEHKEGGFALASGYFFPECKEAAEWLAGMETPFAVSHGMPPESLERSSEDPTIIVTHETREISPLPYEAAANKMTGFDVLDLAQEAKDNMAIPTHKRDALINQWGASPELLDRLEALNAAAATSAKEAGIETKENEAAAEETQTESAQAETVVEETQAEAEVPAESVPPTRQEVADAVASVLAPYLDRIEVMGKEIVDLTAALESVRKEAGERVANEDERVKQLLAETPQASLASMIMNRAIGDVEARVKGNETLARSKPKEAAQASAHGPTAIPMINAFLSPQVAQIEE